MTWDHDTPAGKPAISSAVAVQLFSAILGPSAHPIDRLAARCASIDGAIWSRDELAKCGTRPTSIEGWTAWKDLAKDSINQTDLHNGESAALAAFLRYFIAIAGALAHDGSMITRIPSNEIRRGLNVVGPLVGAEWRELFARARQQLDGSGN